MYFELESMQLFTHSMQRGHVIVTSNLCRVQPPPIESLPTLMEAILSCGTNSKHVRANVAALRAPGGWSPEATSINFSRAFSL